MSYTPNPTFIDWPDTSLQFASVHANNLNTGAKEASDRLDTAEGSMLTAGEGIVPRLFITAGSALTSGSFYLVYFTALKTETITTVRTYTASTAAASATLCRFGIYTVAGNGDLTLTASIASDTALWATTNTTYTKTLSSSWSKVKNTRYAFGLIFTGTTPPALMSVNLSNTTSAYNIYSTAPRLAATLTGLSDLPSTQTEASLSTSVTARFPYAEFIP